MRDSRDNPKLIGIIDLSTESLLNEDCTGRVNLPNGIGECSIYVYNNEGRIPHFHIIPKDQSIGECCVCIYQALYFNHGNKQLKLNSKQRKKLNDWLKSRFSPMQNSNWEVISLMWIIGNGKQNVPNNPSQPDYTYLENMRD